MSNNKEIYNMQLVRGLAALLVVFEHLLPFQIQKYVPQGQIGVSMFFFISGFVMVYTFKEQESGILFLKKKDTKNIPCLHIIIVTHAYLFRVTDTIYFICSA